LSQLRGIDESAAADFRRELTSEHAGHHLKNQKRVIRDPCAPELCDKQANRKASLACILLWS